MVCRRTLPLVCPEPRNRRRYVLRMVKGPPRKQKQKQNKNLFDENRWGREPALDPDSVPDLVHPSFRVIDSLQLFLLLPRLHRLVHALLKLLLETFRQYDLPVLLCLKRRQKGRRVPRITAPAQEVQVEVEVEVQPQDQREKTAPRPKGEDSPKTEKGRGKSQESSGKHLGPQKRTRH